MLVLGCCHTLGVFDGQHADQWLFQQQIVIFFWYCNVHRFLQWCKMSDCRGHRLYCCRLFLSIVRCSCWVFKHVSLRFVSFSELDELTRYICLCCKLTWDSPVDSWMLSSYILNNWCNRFISSLCISEDGDATKYLQIASLRWTIVTTLFVTGFCHSEVGLMVHSIRKY